MLLGLSGPFPRFELCCVLGDMTVVGGRADVVEAEDELEGAAVEGAEVDVALTACAWAICIIQRIRTSSAVS